MMNTTHSKSNRSSLNKQRGIATLFIAVVLLAIMSLTAFFTSRILVMDQEVAGNQYRTSRALMSAEAGLDALHAQFNSPSRANFIDASGDLITGPHYPLATSQTTPFNTLNTANVGIVTSTVTLADISTAGGDNSILSITSLGCWKESGAGVLAACDTCSTACPTNATISQTFVFRGALAGVPSAPLTAKGDISLNSAAITVTNTEGPAQGLTIHAGGTVTANAGNLETLPGRPPESSIASNDSELSTIGTDDFFAKFFGQDKATYKDNANYQHSCNGVCNDKLGGLEGAVIWVDASGSLPVKINSNTVIGSPTNPVILIVNGNLQINGSAIIYGIVYSANTVWNNTGGGTSQIVGAAIAEGDFMATGTPNPTYDSSVLNNLANTLGNYYKIPGSWRDF